MACMAAKEMGSLVFVDGVTADKSSSDINPEVSGAVLSHQI